MKAILDLNQINNKDRDFVGNKAFNLSFLSKHGFKVPLFFVITTGVKEISPAFKREIFAFFDSLGTERVAVRSSATCEDRVNSSFAGQFESYLSVNRGKLFEKIKKCQAMTSARHILSYCKFHNIDPKQIKMAVIVQKMVRAEKGGVIFTRDIFNNTDGIVIEAAKGLGENVVSGLIDPHRIYVPKNGKVNFSKFDGKVLKGEEIKKLFKIAKRIEKIYGKPQDIEWAIERGKIYILQTRPITC